MNKEKQIEEIQEEIIRWSENAYRTGNYGYALSEHLVDKGYRKSTDVAREIFEEIDEMTYGFRIMNTCAMINLNELAELQKKYTEKKQ